MARYKLTKSPFRYQRRRLSARGIQGRSFVSNVRDSFGRDPRGACLICCVPLVMPYRRVLAFMPGLFLYVSARSDNRRAAFGGSAPGGIQINPAKGMLSNRIAFQSVFGAVHSFHLLSARLARTGKGRPAATKAFRPGPGVWACEILGRPRPKMNLAAD